MNLRKIDLNLLVIFDALMSESSVAAAAVKVGITPSAMSHALGRLRRTLDDEIVRRAPRGMVPTRRARQLAQRTRGILRQVECNPAAEKEAGLIYARPRLLRAPSSFILARARARASAVTCMPRGGLAHFRSCSTCVAHWARSPG
jgi:DNA-binding transcriptional LysR family regulator